ncbi:hypothetical protein K432DRAFT_278506, partial [Lepidopterella palustris CBS 459.81]
SPPSPPARQIENPLDDIYGSAPTSPLLHPTNPSASHHLHPETLTDLPLQRRQHTTSGYRDGLSSSKTVHVQSGFDEGYSLGASLGQRVGYILGALEGMVVALRAEGDRETERYEEARRLLENAREELRIEEVLGSKWVDGEGIWMWDAGEMEADVTFKEVADKHPVITTWMEMLKKVAGRWGVDLNVLGR